MSDVADAAGTPAIDERGEAELVLGKRTYALRPSYQAIRTIEKKTGRSLLELTDAGRRVAVRSRLRADGRLVVDDERGAEAARELGDRDAAQRQFAVGDRRRVGEEVEERGFRGWLHPASIVTLAAVTLLLI